MMPATITAAAASRPSQSMSRRGNGDFEDTSENTTKQLSQLIKLLKGIEVKIDREREARIDGQNRIMRHMDSLFTTGSPGKGPASTMRRRGSNGTRDMLRAAAASVMTSSELLNVIDEAVDGSATGSKEVSGESDRIVDISSSRTDRSTNISGDEQTEQADAGSRQVRLMEELMQETDSEALLTSLRKQSTNEQQMIERQAEWEATHPWTDKFILTSRKRCEHTSNQIR